MKIKNILKKFKAIKDRIILIEDKFWDKLWGMEGYKEIEDTTPKEFEKWVSKQVSRGLMEGDGIKYALAIRGQNNIPTIGKDFYLFGDYSEADDKRRRLQNCGGNSNKILDVVKVRVYFKRVD